MPPSNGQDYKAAFVVPTSPALLFRSALIRLFVRADMRKPQTCRTSIRLRLSGLNENLSFWCQAFANGPIAPGAEIRAGQGR